jgi:uncharacterized membrane-anchored protein
MSDVRNLSTPQNANATGTQRSELLSKVPEVTVFFWIIKVLCTTVGETASDFLNVNLSFGLRGTAIAAGCALLVVLFFQFRTRKYLPAIYWLTVVLISVFGTLVTDILTDSLGFPLEASTIIFSVALGATFVAWYVKEGTLSIHSIYTPRREAFYWSAILFTFALGTASGDLMAESLGLGYLVTGLIVLGVITAAVIAWRLGLDAVLGFWIVYVLTRPLGASLGDYLSQPRASGGLGLGATITSVVFLAAILGVVTFLAVTRRDFIAGTSKDRTLEIKGAKVGWQVAIVGTLLLLVAGVGYQVRRAQLRGQASASVSPSAPLGELTKFRTIAADMLRAVRGGDTSAAKSGADALETAWDKGQAVMRPMNPEKWAVMDGAIDDVLKNVRSEKSNAESSASLEVFLGVMERIADRKPTPLLAVAPAPPPVSGAKPLGDLSLFARMADDMLALVRAGDIAGVKARAGELETAWDKNQPRLQPANPAKWALVDSAVDDVLTKTRSPQYHGAERAAAIEALLAVIDTLDGKR